MKNLNDFLKRCKTYHISNDTRDSMFLTYEVQLDAIALYTKLSDFDKETLDLLIKGAYEQGMDDNT